MMRLLKKKVETLKGGSIGIGNLNCLRCSVKDINGLCDECYLNLICNFMGQNRHQSFGGYLEEWKSQYG